MKLTALLRTMLFAFATGLGGCGTTPVSVESPLVQSPAIDPLPVDVDVVYLPSVANHECFVDMPGLGDFAISIRDATTRTFDLVLPSLFTVVGTTTAQQGKRHQLSGRGLISIGVRQSKCLVNSFHVVYDVELSCLDGITSVNSTARGGANYSESRWLDKGIPWLLGAAGQTAIAARYAIRRAAHDFVDQFLTSPEIRQCINNDQEAFAQEAQETGSRTPIGSDIKDGIVLLLVSGNPPDYHERIRNCIQTNIESHTKPMIDIVEELQFRNALFPWFEHYQMPRNAKELNSILSTPIVSQRIRSLGVRYVFVVSGEITNKEVGPGMFCGGGYGGGGCFGLLVSETKSSIRVEFWDLVAQTEKAELSATAAGKAALGAFVLPVPLYVTFSEQTACRKITEAIAKVVAGENGGSP